MATKNDFAASLNLSVLSHLSWLELQQILKIYILGQIMFDRFFFLNSESYIYILYYIEYHALFNVYIVKTS